MDATQVAVRIPPDQLAQLDAWIAAQPDPKPSRPEAIRAFIAVGLAVAEGAQLPVTSEPDVSAGISCDILALGDG